jgi:hypothetical protein
MSDTVKPNTPTQPSAVHAWLMGRSHRRRSLVTFAEVLAIGPSHFETLRDR